ncbi:hypothetical protein F503_06795 [Ophiostoma piceae UAMH 11346]|uniref:Uncharacterized protein n=1 Tax=Ophiostoma piceae (strain UAMH 11346) TaxID=1262450 RepID=S3BQ49_OPHP1|nr:hypothetical protein F503_06795 [Ophiostoma piceae UAMH 11346]
MGVSLSFLVLWRFVLTSNVAHTDCSFVSLRSSICTLVPSGLDLISRSLLTFLSFVLFFFNCQLLFLCSSPTRQSYSDSRRVIYLACLLATLLLHLLFFIIIHPIFYTHSTIMPSRKPTLALTTPTTTSFPAEALKSAASVRTPHSAIHSSWREAAGLPSAGFLSAGLPSAGLSSAGLQSPIVAIKTEEGLIKTPISPPVAYMDFLKMHSPITANPSSGLPPPSTSQPNAAANSASNTNTSRPRLLHRASISGPVKISPSSLNATARSKANPAAASSTSLSSASSSDEESAELLAGDDALDSGPSTAASSTSTGTDCSTSCDCGHMDKNERSRKSPKIARIDTSIPPSPFSANNFNFPMSAPAVGRTTFPSLKIPISPAIGNNLSQVNSPIRSPFSAKSTIVSPFDWESALKARYAEFKSPSSLSKQQQTKTSSCSKCSKAPSTPATAPILTSDTTSSAAGTKSSIRHIREVVTRTVTYTPRMQAAPKGKKRKIECDEAH